MIVEAFSIALPAVSAVATLGRLFLDYRQELRHLLATRISTIRPKGFAEIEVITKAYHADVCRMISDHKTRKAVTEVLTLLCRAADANSIRSHWRSELSRGEYGAVYQLLVLARPLVHLILPADCEFANLYGAMGISI
jgi:hypothetical protein